MKETSWVKDTIVITNRKLVAGDYLRQIEKVAALHPYAMILREKDLSDEDYETLAEAVLAICAKKQVPCFLHSRLAIARKLGCKNIHLAAAALEELAEQLDDFAQVSVSCHSLKDVQWALAHGASQIVLGTIFETDCKPGKKGAGCAFVHEITEYLAGVGSHVPVFAIGGIDPKNLAQVKEAGARGGCMMSYLMQYQ